MLETVPQGRGKHPITGITWMQTRLASARTPTWNELCTGQGSRIIHLKHLCKSLSVLKEEDKGTSTWPPGQSEQNPYVWMGLATHLWKKVYLFQYRFYLIMFLNNSVIITYPSPGPFHWVLSFALSINKAFQIAMHTHAHGHTRTHTHTHAHTRGLWGPCQEKMLINTRIF